MILQSRKATATCPRKVRTLLVLADREKIAPNTYETPVFLVVLLVQTDFPHGLIFTVRKNREQHALQPNPKRVWLSPFNGV